MLDMHKLEVSGLQCCVCVPSSLFPAAADNSYWTRSARYGVCLLMGIVVCLPVCCVCVSMECVVLCVCSSLSIYLCLFTIYRCCVSVLTKDVSRTTHLSQR